MEIIMSNITINAEQRLFVIKTGDGYTTHGFDRLFEQASQLLSALAKKIKGSLGVDVIESEKGTLKQYDIYKQLLKIAENYELGTWYKAATPTKVKTILEQYRKSGETLRVFYGDKVTGRDWMEENDTIGTIGRSTGILKIPLIVPLNDFGGPSLLDDCVVRIIDVASNKEIYRQPNYHQEAMVIVPTEKADLIVGEDLPFGVDIGESLHARFNTYNEAAAWISFMSGISQYNPFAETD